MAKKRGGKKSNPGDYLFKKAVKKSIKKPVRKPVKRRPVAVKRPKKKPIRKPVIIKRPARKPVKKKSVAVKRPIRRPVRKKRVAIRGPIRKPVRKKPVAVKQPISKPAKKPIAQLSKATLARERSRQQKKAEDIFAGWVREPSGPTMWQKVSRHPKVMRAFIRAVLEIDEVKSRRPTRNDRIRMALRDVELAHFDMAAYAIAEAEDMEPQEVFDLFFSPEAA